MKYLFSSLRLLFCVGGFSVLMGNPVFADTLTVLSGTNWKSNNTLVAGWQTLGFDDSSWPSARAPYPNPTQPTDHFPGTAALFMWYDPAGTSDGTTGSIEAFFRFTFALSGLPLQAQARMIVDDDFDLYVNGNLVFVDHDCGFASIPHFVDLTSSLQAGQNVIAIQARDGCWDSPFDRAFEAVLFEATITLPMVVQIDIKPGSFPNSINLSSAGVIPVAILSSPTFDATQVNPATVTLAGARVRLIGKGDKYACSPQDVNADGLIDLVCHVVTAQAFLTVGDTIAVLDAQTFGGVAIRGQDSIQIVPD